MKDIRSENLIVIIGNGFDRAHGLETGFNHFADYYLNEIIINDLLNYKEIKQSIVLKKSFIDTLESPSQVSVSSGFF